MTCLYSEHLGFVEWAVAARNHPNEQICGDAHIVEQVGTKLLFGVIDGLGHGLEAAQASQQAIKTILEQKESPPVNILRECHQELKSTRGAVLSLALIDRKNNKLEWVGVGNVEGVLMRSAGPHEWLSLRSGIVGCRMPNIQSMERPISCGDLLVMFSDGIQNQCLDQVWSHDSATKTAERIMDKRARGTDDAIILIAKYYGDADFIG